MSIPSSKRVVVLCSVALLVVLSVTSARAAPAGTVKARQPRAHWTVVGTASVANFFMPSALVGVERAIGRHFGVQASVGGAWLVTSLLEARLSAQLYFLKSFQRGIQLGAETRGFFTFDDKKRDSFSHGMLAVFLGYKHAAASGMTWNLRVGAFAFYYIAGVDDKTTDLGGPPLGLYLDFSLGYSF